MRNKQFPKYPDDTDYNTNSPSYYEDLARKNKLIQLLAEKIWDYDERLDNRITDLEQVLSSYLSQWDERIENLDDEVSHIFVTWLNDGTLEQIINHDVLGNKADKTYVDDINEIVTTQLAQIVRETGISPDDYEGTDFEKVQQAVDDAILSNGGVRLTRIYDITNDEAIMLDKTGGRWTLRFFGTGGGFRKTNAGPMFSSNNDFYADVNFINVSFSSIAGSGTEVIDGDRIIIINTMGCTFYNLDKLVKSTTYLQSVRSIGDRITGGSGNFIETPSAYDLVFDNTLVEVRESFFKQTSYVEGSPHSRLYNARFSNTTVEGLSGRAFDFRSIEVLNMDGTYLEMNKGGNIVFDPAGRFDHVTIENSRGYESPSDTDRKPLIKWGGTIRHVKTSNNRMNNAPVHDLTNIVAGTVQSENEESGYNRYNNVGQTRTNFIVVGGIATTTLHPTSIEQEIPPIKRLNSRISQTVPARTSALIQVSFEEDIFRDDFVSVQIYSGLNAQLKYVRHIRNATNKKLLDVWVNNESDSDSTPEVFATVLKVPSFSNSYG